jgi:hypothetical protein
VQHFVAYHNADQEGHRFNNGRAIRPGGSGWWFTAKHYRKETILGNRLWGIEGSGSPKRYQLVSTDIITQLIPRKRPAPYEGKGLDVQFRADVALQRTDITGLSWFRRLREEQRSFSYGLNKIKDRKVIAALETMRGKGAAGEAGGHPGGKSGQPAADSQRHKLPIAVARHSPSVAKEIVRELIPTKHLTDVSEPWPTLFDLRIKKRRPNGVYVSNAIASCLRSDSLKCFNWARAGFISWWRVIGFRRKYEEKGICSLIVMPAIATRRAVKHATSTISRRLPPDIQTCSPLMRKQFELRRAVAFVLVA